MAAQTAAPATTAPQPDLRLAALRRFAIAITVFNLLGHFWFGFEQSYAQPLVSLATAYLMELALEWMDARIHRRVPRFRGGFVKLVNFLLSAHISGLAVAMLVYPNERLLPISFAAAVAIGSKYLLRAPAGNGSRHYFNPSNLGITVTLLCFPWVGIAAPYMFTENLPPTGDWIVPLVIIASGSFLNTRFTKRMPLIATWLGCFALQAMLRPLLFGTAWGPPLAPMTGVAFILFTFYMVTDPATTPSSARGQVLFGASVAVAYCALISMHIVFDLFFALTLVCAGRGVAMWVGHLVAQRSARDVLAGAGAAERAGV